MNYDVEEIKSILGVNFWELLADDIFLAPNNFWQGLKTDFFGFYFLGTFGDALRSHLIFFLFCLEILIFRATDSTAPYIERN